MGASRCDECGLRVHELYRVEDAMQHLQHRERLDIGIYWTRFDVRAIQILREAVVEAGIDRTVGVGK